MSRIEWTDETWNPVTGCSRVSPGCDNCYMYAQYPRLNAMGVRGYATNPDDVQMFPERLENPLRWTRPRMVFVNSMSDLFHPEVDWGFITRVFEVMRDASTLRGHVFQVLTKRPGIAARWWDATSVHFEGNWPEGVWMGVSVESQRYTRRLDVLARLPAAVRFVSAEPLLGPLDLTHWIEDRTLNWVIVGGESGRAARPMDIGWAESLLGQCNQANIAFFLKQLGGRSNKRGGDAALLNGQTHREFPAPPSAAP